MNNIIKLKIKRALIDPLYVIGFFVHRISPLIKNDTTYLKLNYYLQMHKKLNLNNPQTYNEKLNWLKLNDYHTEYTAMVDKVSAKDYVRRLIGNDHIIPTLGVWEHFDDIDFDHLPGQFVLKTTHDSGGVVIVRDKKNFDRETAKRKLEKSLKHDYYIGTREYPYRDVKHRIIAEKYMVDESGTELKDYKFFCFNGKCKMLFIATDRPYDTRFDFFDTDFRHLPFRQGHPNADKVIKKPEKFEEMINIAEKLAAGLPHLRVDLYNINGNIYFGELTFFHFSGIVPFEPEEWDYKIGSWLRLPSTS